MPSGSDSLRNEITPLSREEMALALTAENSGMKIDCPDDMSAEEFLDLMERKTGGIACVLIRVANMVNNGTEVQKAVESVCHHEQAGYLRTLDSVHDSLDNQGKEKMLALARELVGLFESHTAYPGVFHDGGLTTVDSYRQTCRVINESGFLALVEFLRTSDPKWDPIDLKVSARHAFYRNCTTCPILSMLCSFVSMLYRIRMRQHCLRSGFSTRCARNEWSTIGTASYVRAWI